MRLPDPKPLRDAETDFVWVIVPFSRPENIERVLSNFSRQKFPFKRLVVVENGRALGASAPYRDRIALVLNTERHQSIAKNLALHEIRKRGGGFTVVMDDDDWYGPSFLTEACGYAKTYDIVGKSRHFVSVDGGLWLCGREKAHSKYPSIAGSTVACWAEAAPEYPLVATGEEGDFCLKALRQGMSLFGTDLYHYLYLRDSRADHTWGITAEDLRAHESARGALDLGVIDYDIIKGERLDVPSVRLEARQDADTLSPPPPGAAHVPA